MAQALVAYFLTGFVVSRPTHFTHARAGRYQFQHWPDCSESSQREFGKKNEFSACYPELQAATARLLLLNPPMKKGHHR
jgi:hypothetical protein